MSEPLLILVNEQDNIIGTLEKLEVHQKALLHRAVSVFIVNSKGEWIIQRRALNKYHSNGLWTNTCCSHPYPDETCHEAANRRLKEEMGLQCELKEVFSFIYREQLDNNLTEHEYDHVFIGFSDDIPVPDKQEVIGWRVLSFRDLEMEINCNPDHFTVWFRQIYQRVNDSLESLDHD
jgi:isopentenyl-diphosphate delta-isomerase